MQDFGIQILQIPPFDEAIREHWEVSAHDVDLFGFSALCEPAMQYPWSLCINVAEFVTQQPLEGQFRARIGAAIAAVQGVSAIEEADREVWVVAGEIAGEALVEAVLTVLLEMAGELHSAVQQAKARH